MFVAKSPRWQSQRSELRFVLTTTICSLLFLVWMRGSRIPVPEFEVIPEEDDFPILATSHDHPIKALYIQAETRFDHMRSRQSSSFGAAVAEYERRYNRSPPVGFEAWFEYAKAVESPIVDDFDILDKAIAPFLRFSGQDIARRMRKVRDVNDATWWCEMIDGRLSSGCEQFGEVFLRLFADSRILDSLPNVAILVNSLDEPRVLARRAFGLPKSKRDAGRDFVWKDSSHQGIWQQIAVNQCGRRAFHKVDNQADSEPRLDFVQDHRAALDLCQHPEYEHMHGLWASPATFKTTRDAVPVMSPAVVSTMADIPFPAIAYNQGMYAYDEAEGVEWDEKVAALYWAGGTTGGLQMNGSDAWKEFHRQRFVSFANDLERRNHTLLKRRIDDDGWEPHASESLNASAYVVHFTNIVQCEEEACDDVRDWFGSHEPDDRGETLKYTLTMDLDGNGHSGRFYRLLASRSLPLKQTIFHEWHDDRLIPWLHYVPISLGMEELPEVVRYLTEEEEGRDIAREMAIQGREWLQEALRPEDQVAYLFRLMLELARLQDEDRRSGES